MQVVGVGSYTPTMQEVDAAVVRRSNVIIDTEDALSCGDFAHAELSDNQWQSLGQLLMDQSQSRRSKIQVATKNNNAGVDCTFFKSVGTAVQDVATAAFVQNRAEELDVGTKVPF